MPPVPKKKHTRSRSNKRRAAGFTLSLPNLTRCKHCGMPKLPHKVCKYCGKS